jgi:electron transfer flavoprotein alpha subunit
MSVIVFAEAEGGFKKSTYEAVSYGKDLANKLGTNCIAVSINYSGGENLGKYGADKMINIQNDILSDFSPYGVAQALAKCVQNEDGNVLIFSQTYTGKSIAPLTAVELEAANISGVVDMIDTTNGFVAKKTCFSNKAFSYVQVNNDVKVISIFPNSYKINKDGSDCEISQFNPNLSDDVNNLTVVETEKATDKIPLTEAELVISGGRGLKGPENWHLVEELATVLNAGTACSKPVSDMEWRPHSEHVGQTGITIKPNLYIAVGISGAIQHLAGVGSSKVICVINTDPEAPFFKAADYGIVGDAFEVVPKLIKRAKEIKGIA